MNNQSGGAAVHKGRTFQMNAKLKINGKYTLINISSFATTNKIELIISGDSEQQRYFYKAKGRRKEYLLPQLTDSLLFEGHNLPLLVDSETNRFMGNACINFVTDDAVKLKDYIQQHCINPDLETFAKIMVTPAHGRDIMREPSYTPLFPCKSEE